MYLPAMGDLGPTDFNSTKYPGVCKASTPAALEIFKSLQRQINRCAYAKDLGKIGVDGDIGPGTVALFKKVQNAATADASDASSPGQVMAAAVASYGNTPCSAIASMADAIVVNLQMYADALGAPASVPSSIVTSPTTIVSANGTETQIAGAGANILDSVGNLSTLEKVVAVGLVGAIGYMAMGARRSSRRRRR